MNERQIPDSLLLTRRQLGLLGAAGLVVAGMATITPYAVAAREAEPGDDRGGHGNDDPPGDDRGRGMHDGRHHRQRRRRRGRGHA